MYCAFRVCFGDALRVEGAQRLPHAPPDRRLRLCGNLLAHDVMHHCGEQVGVCLAVHMAHRVDHRAQNRVFLLEIFRLFFAV